MLNNELNRLLEQDPWDVNDLAQTLYCILGQTDPAPIPEGIQLTQSDIPPIQLGNYPAPNTPGGNPAVFKITRKNGASISLTIDNNNDPAWKKTGADGVETPVSGSGSGTSFTTFPGKVVSGSGSVYNVNLYRSGLSRSPVAVTVTQLQIDPAETIPPDTWASVTQMSDSTYFMQVPVFV